MTKPHTTIEPEAPKPKPPVIAMTEEEKSWHVIGTRPWRYIIVHHSATDGGSARTFDVAHRHRGWDELGYHFVITNGAGGSDGVVEVGSRWRKQKWGAHCGGTPDNEYNNHGIGICLVGDFTRRMPSARQLSALKRLVTFLIRVYSVPPENVMGHRDGPNCATACPGELLHRYVWGPFRREINYQTASTE